MFDDSKNIHKYDNISLEFDIQRYIDVSIASNFDNDDEFGITDAIPISLNVESFIFIKTCCMHNIIHIFQLPLKTEIKWKIKGGTDNGAFKIGSGMDAEYFARDCGDSVIFYPQLQTIGKNTIHKKICIELTINQLGSSLVEQQEYKFIVDVNILIIRRFLKTNYRIKMFFSRMDNEDDDNNNLDNNILNSDIVENPNDIKNTTKIEQEGNQLLFKSFNNCKICNLSVIVNLNNILFHIKFFKHHLITTEIIKIPAETTNPTKQNDYVLLTGTNYKKYFLDGLQIQPRLFWKSNSGKLVYGNLGQSLIYYTPGEEGLSKSPLTINLCVHYDHKIEDLQEASLSDSTKLWILRQPPLMGG